MAARTESADRRRRAISPAMRRRLQQCYDRGMQNTQSGNYDYATEMLTQCVLGDPGNQIYAQSFSATCIASITTTKKGAHWRASARQLQGGHDECRSKKDWPGMIKSGMEVLKINPWDISALVHIAKACGELKHVDAS